MSEEYEVPLSAARIQAATVVLYDHKIAETKEYRNAAKALESYKMDLVLCYSPSEMNECNGKHVATLDRYSHSMIAKYYELYGEHVPLLESDNVSDWIK